MLDYKSSSAGKDKLLLTAGMGENCVDILTAKLDKYRAWAFDMGPAIAMSCYNPDCLSWVWSHEYVKENIHKKYTYLLHVEDMGIDNRTLNAPALQLGYYVSVCVPFATHSLLQLSLLSELTSFWHRFVVIPTGATLRSPFQIKDYLLSPGTCKCGLPCPLRPEYFFDFNVQIFTSTSLIIRSFVVINYLLTNCQGNEMNVTPEQQNEKKKREEKRKAELKTRPE
uniref:MBD domain-containing protein n=1 Tax=Glossina morsitans morsitans TaxID=37546 RepID=A0A1B0FGI6_GLOMM